MIKIIDSQSNLILLIGINKGTILSPNAAAKKSITSRKA